MEWLCRFAQSSVIKKQVMAVTGLLLMGFLVSHMIGNYLLVVGPEAFNIYAHTLTSNPLIYVAEAGLAAIFFTHLAIATRLTLENKKARPVGYYMKENTGRGGTFASGTMIYTGMIIFIFMILHLLHFKFGSQYFVTYDGLEVRDLYKTVIEYFANPLHVGWYIIAMIATGVHLTHGFSSVFQSLGFFHKKYNCWIGLKGKIFAALISVGFSFLAVYCYFQGGQ